MISRRHMMKTSASVAAGVGLLPALSMPSFAQSNKVNVDALMELGPLPEKALGAEDAPVTVVEYASMTCPHCAAFHAVGFKHLMTNYVDTGKVRFVMREFPFDPVATAVFMLARCAPNDGYFDLIDVYFEKQMEWASASNKVVALQKIALQLGFTQETFKECLTNQEVLDGVNWVRKRGEEEFEVVSTPTFFVNGTRLTGNVAIEKFDEVIADFL